MSPHEVIDLMELNAELLAVLRDYLKAQPQCECTDTRACRMAAAREKARAIIAKAEWV